ncbi:MAG: DUF1668 domain-containing protein [Bryobacterales bacterium]|nr:DUF1668 domain-containing protein [Bryobacterales bacterium]
MKKSIFRWSAFQESRRGLALAGIACLLLTAPQAVVGGTVGRVVAIGGHASDLALDEARGVLYVANFTANRVDVVNAAEGTVQSSINVAAQPSSLALSVDGRYLVVAHYGTVTAPASPSNGVTVIDLSANSRSSFSLGSAPLGVAFGLDNKALIVTTTEFLLFDPVSGNAANLGSISGVTTRALPQPLASFPSNIVAASMAPSGDGLFVFGSAAVQSGSGASSNGGQTLEFTYDVTTKRVNAIVWTWAPPPGPRAVSANYDGSLHMTGWAMHDRNMDIAINQLPNGEGLFNVGTHVFDHVRGRVYAQYREVSQSTQQNQVLPPAHLLVLDADNLAVRERLLVPENFGGKSIVNSDASLMYGISESGIMMVPLGDTIRAPRIVANKEDLVFRGNFCDRRVSSQEITLLDPSGANTDYSIAVNIAGVTVTPAQGVTPATIRVNVDPNAFQNQKGTVTGLLTITSSRAANVIKQVRLLINNREPDQRGTAVNIPGTLVDLLTDPVRDRFYVLRQDTNQVLVFDATNQTQIATLRTANVPTQLAITFDRRWLLIGSDAAQLIRVYDLETLEESIPIRMPSGHYPRSIAASGRAILAASRVAGPEHKISRVDFPSRVAIALPTLGIYENKIDINTTLVPAPNGRTILGVQATGGVLLYDANADTFTISRKDFPSLAGAYAASSFDQYVVGNQVLNASLVSIGSFESNSGRSSGFAFLDQGGFRTVAPDSASPGIIQRVAFGGSQLLRGTRMVEAPLLAAATGTTNTQPTTANDQRWVPIFTRTVQPLYSRNALISLTTSGITVLPWNFDAATAIPRIERVVNSGDSTSAVAPGSLVSIFGSDLSPINQATQQMPAPTALGESCLTVNGIPVPVIFVSPNQINGQLPFQADGSVQMVLRTPGGVSDSFNLTILPGAPGVFRNGTAGAQRDLPAVFRASNGLLVTDTNPVHRGDTITIYLTGLGRTSPSVEAGVPAPSDPLAAVLVAPTVRLGGAELPVDFAGLVPNTIGVYQINARVPFHTPIGFDQSLTVSQGSSSTSVSVRVID